MNPGSLSPMLLYELQLHLSATTPPVPRGKSSTSNEEEELKYEDMKCGCCFSDMNVDQAVSCAEGCLFCKECLSRTVQESVFGQAPLRLYSDLQSSTKGGGEGTGIRCLSIEGCQASFSDKELRRSLSSDLYTALEARLAQQNLQLYQASMRKSAQVKKQIRTVQCPFCPYTEVEEVPGLTMLWEGFGSLTEVMRSIASLLSVGVLYFLWVTGAIFFPDLLNMPSQRMSGKNASFNSPDEERDGAQPIYFALQPAAGLQAITRRMQQMFDVCMTKHGSTVFRCKNASRDDGKATTSTFASLALVYGLLPPAPPSSLGPAKITLASTSNSTCGRPSCRLCLKLHYSGHECVDSTEGLRLVKEQAASNAVKRQCPECGLSFVKDTGCNKIVCRCGYSMCFVCRKGIGQERYAHFCQHVRDRELFIGPSI